MIKYELQIASLKQEDAKKELERRLLVAMQDNAIAQMTIGDLEQRLEKRSKMFEGMRSKVEDDLKKDNAIREEHFADELQNAQNKIGELESCCATQKQTIFQWQKVAFIECKGHFFENLHLYLDLKFHIKLSYKGPSQ